MVCENVTSFGAISEILSFPFLARNWKNNQTFDEKRQSKYHFGTKTYLLRYRTRRSEHFYHPKSVRVLCLESKNLTPFDGTVTYNNSTYKISYTCDYKSQTDECRIVPTVYIYKTIYWFGAGLITHKKFMEIK